jgi:hypothetical protein
MLAYNLSFPEFWLRLKIHFSRAVTPSFAKSLFIKCQSRKERGKRGGGERDKEKNGDRETHGKRTDFKCLLTESLLAHPKSMIV